MSGVSFCSHLSSLSFAAKQEWRANEIFAGEPFHIGLVWFRLYIYVFSSSSFQLLSIVPTPLKSIMWALNVPRSLRMRLASKNSNLNKCGNLPMEQFETFSAEQCSGLFQILRVNILGDKYIYIYTYKYISLNQTCSVRLSVQRGDCVLQHSPSRSWLEETHRYWTSCLRWSI